MTRKAQSLRVVQLICEYVSTSGRSQNCNFKFEFLTIFIYGVILTYFDKSVFENAYESGAKHSP